MRATGAVVAFAVCVGSTSCSRTDLELGEAPRPGSDAALVFEASTVCETCDAGSDARRGEDARAPTDAAEESSAEAGPDAGSFECGPMTCNTSEVCIELIGGCQTIGAPCVTSADCCTNFCCNGFCSAFPAADGGCSGGGDGGPFVGYACQPKPAGCEGGVSCACAPQTLCAICISACDCEAQLCPVCSSANGTYFVCGTA